MSRVLRNEEFKAISTLPSGQDLLAVVEGLNVINEQIHQLF